MRTHRVPVLLLMIVLASCSESTTPPPANRGPLDPFSPSPAHMATGVVHPTVTLRWSSGDPDGDSLTYDVFFGAGTPTQIADDRTVDSITVSVAPATHYRWRVIVRDRRGATTQGPTWEFTTGDIDLDRALVAWFPFDGNTEEAGPLQLVGTATDVTLTADRAGRASRAARFNGASSYVGVQDVPLLRFGERSFTVSAWIQASGSPSNFEGIVAKQLDDPSKSFFPGFQLSFRSGGAVEAAIASDVARTEIVTGRQLADGAWHMLTMVVDSASSTLRLYVDGDLVETRPRMQGSISSGAPVYIGRERRGQVYYRGVIDDVAIFDRALNEAEILRLKTYRMP